jgi:hypothetical protein
MKYTKSIISISVIIVVIILYLNYTYSKIEKFDPQVFTGANSLKTLILNGYNPPLPPNITIENDVMCDRTNPNKIKCIDKITIDHPLTPDDL